MTLLTPAPAIPAPAPRVDLETRLALADAAMSVRLDEAAAQFAIRTAHIDTAPPAALAEVVPLTPTLAPPTCPYSTRIAAVLWQAARRIETHGWHQGDLRDDQAEARCILGAIQIEARGDRGLTSSAAALLLDAIQRDFPDATTVPSWNDAQTSPAPVLLYLNRTAQHAADRGL